MASYQIPQFLDAGDKIFLMMNVRQFGYFLVGLFGSFIIYAVLQGMIPDIGFWVFLPIAPFMLLFLYLAMGKYNGRDVEIYVFKMIIYLFKPRILKFVRTPDVEDLNKQMGELTPEKIQNRWEKEYKDKLEAETNNVAAFDVANRGEKISKISKLARSIEDPVHSAAYFTAEKEIRIKQIEIDMQNIERAKLGLPPLPKPLVDNNQAYSKINNTNFFNENKE